jgi:outer membrane protein
MKINKEKLMSLRTLLSVTFILAMTFTFSYAQPLTLDDCISLAKQNNLQLQQVKMDVDAARASLTDANSSFYPSISASTNYRYGGSASVDASGSFSTGINAQYTLYKGGSIRAGSKIAKTRIKIAEETYQQKENEIVLSIKQTFYKILQTQDQITLVNSILKRRNDNLTLLKLNYSVGRENEPNVKQAEVSLNQTEYDYLQAEQSLALAKLSLSQLLNLPGQEMSIQYQDKIIEFPLPDSLIKLADNERPEIISQKANRDVLTEQKTQAVSNYLPTLSVSSSYGLSGDNFFKQNDNWSAGIGLSLPIFNGFSTQVKVNQVSISIKQNDLKLQDLTNSIESEVRQAYSSLTLAKKNLEVNNKTLEAAQDAYQLTKLQYEQGSTSYFFLQQKESDLTQVENSNVNALYNLRTSVAALEKAIGRSN